MTPIVKRKTEVHFGFGTLSRNPRRIVALALCMAGLVSGAAVAGPTDQVRDRIANLRQLGAAYKAVNDGLRASDVAKVRQAAAQITVASRNIYYWFPRGSGPQPGVRTKAKPDIWTRPAQFRAAQDAFARQAAAFQRATAGADLDLIRTQSRMLGATCKSCHDSFREADD